MPDLYRNRRQLNEQALMYIGALESGQAAEVEDLDRMDGHVDAILAYLQAKDIFYVQYDEEVPIEARSHVIFAPVDRMDQVLGLALEDPPEEMARATQGNGGDTAPDTMGPPGVEPDRVVAAKPR